MQYYAPWFRYFAKNTSLTLKVFYLWDFGVAARHDPAFRENFTWDIPLMEGYDSEFVPNVATDPGTHHFKGIDNPELGERVKQWKPDAVLLIGYNYTSLLRFIRTWDSRKAPLLFRGDSHRLHPEGSLLQHLKKQVLLRFLYSRFSAFLPVGSANTAYFRTYGVPQRKLFLTPHVVENSRFESTASTVDISKQRAQWNIPSDNIVFLFVGKLETKKRPMDLLEAFAKSSAKNTSMVFAGSGELEETLRTRAKDISKPVRFLGFQNQSAMPSIYASCDVLVLPSYGSYETWGLAVNEAMACERTVIVSSHVGCAEDLVIPGETGWRFPAGDTDALQKCLEDAASDPDRCKQYGMNAQKRLSEQNSYQTATEGLLRALESLS
ncbi:MAG: glycosyltransferase family 4 protein [Chthoniobacterales bacterium]